MSQTRIQHLLVDALDCRGPLDDAEQILSLMRRAAAAVGATEIGQAECRYVPHGVTAVLFLAESHILVSTWPEHGTALFDVLLCGTDKDPHAVRRVLAEGLGAGREEIHEVGRLVAEVAKNVA